MVQIWKYVFGLFCLFSISYSKVVELTLENFENLTNSNDFWLIEFYAQWCTHCPKMDPILNKFSESSSMKVGKLEGPRYRDIGASRKIVKYPTFMWRKGDQEGLYTGPRTLEGFQSFQKQLERDPVLHLTHLENLQDHFEFGTIVFLLTTETTAKVHFEVGAMGTHTPGTQLPHDTLLSQYEELALSLRSEAHFTTLFPSLPDDPADPYVLVKMEIGLPSRSLLFRMDFSQTEGPSLLRSFATEHNRALVNKLEDHNFKRLGSLKKRMLIAVVDYPPLHSSPSSSSQAATPDLISALEEIAEALPFSEQNEIVFGHLDGVKHRRFLTPFEIHSLPALLVLDFRSTHHLHLTRPLTLEEPDSGSSSSSTSSSVLSPQALKGAVSSLVREVLSEQAIYQETTEPGLSRKVYNKYKLYYPWSLIITVVPFILVLVTFLFGHPDKKKRD